MKSTRLTDSREQRIDLAQKLPKQIPGAFLVPILFSGRSWATDLGGIAYDEAAALYPGAVFPEGAKRRSFLSTEVLLVEKDSEELEDLMEGQDARELEALAISHRNSGNGGKRAGPG